MSTKDCIPTITRAEQITEHKRLGFDGQFAKFAQLILTRRISQCVRNRIRVKSQSEIKSAF